MTAPGKILTMVDLKDLGKLSASKRPRIFAWCMAAGLAALLAVAVWKEEVARDLKKSLDAANVQLAAQRSRADGAEAQVRQIKSLMAVSIDARRLGKPLPVSGDMFISFAGEEKP